MLYSASKDRTVKVFNLDEMTYVETLFGHQDSITSLSSMGLRDRCLTTGGRDRTVRLWKIPEESQLLFRASAVGYHPSTVSIAQVTCDTDFSEDENGAKDKRTSVLAKDVTGSVDVVACIDDETWISGSDGGTLCIWNAQRKKPIFTLPNAHGMCVQMGEEKMENGCRSYQFVDRESDASLIASADEAARNGFVAIGNWICAIDAPMNTDLVVSGSCDGTLRFWKFSHHRYGRRNQVLKLVKKVEVPGYINSLAFSPSLNYLIVGVGQEPRTGRWSRISTGRNGIRIIDLSGLAEAIPGK
jgi:ribosomal RNA-processing protein 9